MAKKIAKKTEAKPCKPKGLCGTAKPDRVEQVTVAPSSIELTRDAKGQARWSIKLYKESTDMEDGVMEILRIDKLMRQGTK